MLLAVILIVLAILLGLGGWLLEGLTWLLIVAAVVLVAGLVAGAVERSRLR